MATRKRNQNKAPADREFYDDASYYRRREYSEGDAYGFDRHGASGRSAARGANQYSRYNADAYASRFDPAVNEDPQPRSFRRGPSARNAGGGKAGDGARGYAAPSDGYRDDGYQGYSRDSYGQRASCYSARRKRRARIKIALIVLALILVAGAGSAFAYIKAIDRNLSEGLDPQLKNVLVSTNMKKEPFYMLLLGTDASLERKNDETYAEVFRTDTILLTRIDPVEQKVTLVSMPRDTMIDMGENGTQKLNAAYAIGGASAAVTEVSDLSGVGISHFCLIDMDGLTSVVDALGGIEVDVPMEIDDEDAGGHLDAGLQTLNGEQALILCRSRNAFEEYGAGDLYRAANQRLVLQAIASKILSSNPATIAKSVTAISEFVSTDLSVGQIISLAECFRGIDVQESIYTASMPTHSEYIDELWYEVVDEKAWKTMMDRVDSGLPPSEESVVDERAGVTLANSGDGVSGGSSQSDSSDGSQPEGATARGGSVCVRNGTDVTGAGSAAMAVLEEEGFTVLDAADADATDYLTTLVVYDDESFAAQAQELADLLGDSAEAVQNDGTYTLKGDILVVVGADLAEDIAARGYALESGAAAE
ncbi:MAG: LCP family protein [Coriobacteriaceae bacterium]|nr:LCP family protein [Coriobacteriaceae bacterium]